MGTIVDTSKGDNMPLDTKRLPVPEESFSPLSISKSKDVKDNKTLIDKGGDRCDGRRPEQIRPMFVKTGVVSQAKGSSYVEMSNTKIICAVYGPREVTRREDFSMQGQLNCELKFATFSSCRKRRGHQADAEERDMSDVLLQTMEPAVMLEKFPKARMDVFVTVLQEDGSALAGAICAASAALADAAIDMYDLVAGCSLRQSGSLSLLDPCYQEEYQPKNSCKDEDDGGMTVGLMPSLNQVTAFVQRGHMNISTVSSGFNSCMEGCQRIYPVIQDALTRAVKSQQKTSLKQ